MSKNKRPKGSKKNEQRPSKRPAQRSTSGRLLSTLDRVDDLLDQDEFVEASRLLEELERQYPNSEEVLSRLLEVYYELDDVSYYQSTAEKLLQRRPDDPDLMLAVAGSALTNVYPATALKMFRRFLDRWPNDERADHVRETVGDLEAKLNEIMADAGFGTGPEAMEKALAAEEARSLLERGKYSAVRDAARRLLARWPKLVPVWNNLSEASYFAGEIVQAIEAAQRALAIDGQNVHALSSLGRYLAVSGHAAELAAVVERLKAAPCHGIDHFVKKAQTLAFLGDDQGVLDVFDQVDVDRRELGPRSGILFHLAAVAACRLGHEGRARRLWNEALQAAPNLEVAQENIDDLDLSVGERVGPWPFEIDYWLPKSWIEGLRARLGRAAKGQNEAALSRDMRAFLQKHPEMDHILPALLDRGSPDGREFAIEFARHAKTPTLLVALKDFALGQRGPDKLRMETAQICTQARVLPREPQRLWLAGQWQEILTLGFEVHGEPTRTHGRAVERLAYQALEALKEGRGEDASQLLRQALEIEPDSPDLLNNLAQAFVLQGCDDEGNRLRREIHQRYPDYFFGHIGMVHIRMDEGDLAAAGDFRLPLMKRERLHFTEFDALAEAQIRLCVVRCELDAARSWLDIWKGMGGNPEAQRHWGRLLKPGGLRQVLRNVLR